MPTSLTRKHFEAMAAEIRKLDPGDADLEKRKAHGQYAKRIALALKQFNPRFDVDKFCDACHNSGESHGPRVE